MRPAGRLSESTQDHELAILPQRLAPYLALATMHRAGHSPTTAGLWKHIRRFDDLAGAALIASWSFSRG
jgi:hypothetical protein